MLPVKRYMGKELVGRTPLNGEQVCNVKRDSYLREKM